MLDDEVVGVEPLVLGVALGILQHVQEELGGLDWPPSYNCCESLGSTDNG